MTPDLVISNANVFTADTERLFTNAVALRADKITAVGSGALDEVGPDTEVIDAKGALVTPGFIDAHVHPVTTGLDRLRCSFEECGSSTDAVTTIAAYARTNPHVEWILGSGWSMDWFPRGCPSKELADAAVSDRPEGIIPGPAAVTGIAPLGDGRWDVQLRVEDAVDPDQFRRNFYSTSSCGVCGKASIDALRVGGALAPDGPVVTTEALTGLPAKLLSRQSVFHLTGGLHAAGAFDPSGEMITACEDVGPHNAVDKLVGRLAATRWPLPPLGMIVSGRVSFEVAQKAAVAGIPIVGGVSAASTLAVDLAEEFGMTLVGFIREGGYTIYTDKGRIGH